MPMTAKAKIIISADTAIEPRGPLPVVFAKQPHRYLP